MTWSKLGDEFPEDADSKQLSDAAVRTHVDALCYSSRRRLDLVLPKKDLGRFAFSPNAKRAVDELLAAGWWTEGETAWHLVHHPEWQQSSEDVEKRRLGLLRAQHHKRGNHDLCLPERCPHAALVIDDRTDDKPDDRGNDASDDVNDDSGTGRDGSGTGTTHLEKHLQDSSYATPESLADVAASVAARRSAALWADARPFVQASAS